MKRLLGIVVALILTIFFVSSTHAASVVTSKLLKKAGDMNVLVFTWTAHTDGSVTDTATEESVEGYVVLVVTDPAENACIAVDDPWDCCTGAGAGTCPNPTANYDIDIDDAEGVDVMGAQLDNRHTSNTEAEIPLLDSGASIYGGRPVFGKLTLQISGNSQNGATGRVLVYVAR